MWVNELTVGLRSLTKKKRQIVARGMYTEE